MPYKIDSKVGATKEKAALRKPNSDIVKFIRSMWKVFLNEVSVDTKLLVWFKMIFEKLRSQQLEGNGVV